MNSPAPEFHSELKRFQLRWRIGLFSAGVLRGLLWLGIALLAFGALDYYVAFSDSARRVVAGLLLAIGAAGASGALWDAITFMRRDAASQADAVLHSPRREVLSALELQPGANGAAESALSGWLRGRAVDGATKNLGTLTFARSLPRRPLSRRAKQLLGVMALLGLCALVAPRASWIIARRLVQPAADLPPYSPLRFAVGPQPAEVLYGGEILISADITGARKLEAPVRCLTRDPGNRRVEESPAFQEHPTRFSRKLEKVSAPVEIAFAVGRARSAWTPVAVRMQPKVQEVVLTVEPPAYSGLPTREFGVGTQDLAALAGSRITARVSSNRPLGGGALRIQRAGSNQPEQEIAAERDETHRVRFTWKATSASRVTLQVRDILGTASEPLQLDQKLTPDDRPEVVLRQPAGDVFATPDSELPLEASASDDLGLARVALVRQLRGYRERSLAQPVPAAQRRHDVAGKLNLAPFGVVPGQIIQLTLEAGDTNPNLLGVSVSEPARVHIIAREKYAEMLRAQTTLEDFGGRYEALRDALEQARKSLEELEKAAASDDPAKVEEARRKALEAHQQAGQLFGKIAKDFPIFDLDPALAAASLEALTPLFENSKQLEELWRAQPGEMRDALTQLKKRLADTDQRMASEMKQGERSIAAGKVFEQAGKFRDLIEGQRELAKDLNRVIEQIRRGETQAGQALREIARRQAELAEGVRELEKQLGQALSELPEEFGKMREQGGEFLEALRELAVPPTMDEATKAAENADSKTAGDRAGEALAKLEALLRKKNGICEMCRGGDELQFPWPEDLSQTLEQLMRSLIPKPGSGSGSRPGSGESGGGFSGRSDSGYSMRGKMPQLPIYGPARSRFSRRAGPQVGAGAGKGTGKGDGRQESGAEIDTNTLKSAPSRQPGGEAIVIEAIPEAYREAVKRYFSTDEKTGAAESAPDEQPATPR